MAYTRGEFKTKNGTFGVLMRYNKDEVEIVLVSAGQVASAFRHSMDGDFSFLSNKAKDFWTILKGGVGRCKSKNASPIAYPFGTATIHDFEVSKNKYNIELYNNEVTGANITMNDGTTISLEVTANDLIPKDIPYIKLTNTRKKNEVEAEEEISDDNVIVRSVQEIALEKEDITWLNNKKYYIVNDDEQAEKIFEFLDSYDGVISYDTETTGLKINCFGKINSEYARTLKKYNEEHPKEQLRADRLVGVIFCVEENVSYYFPCFNRKFKNLYDTDTPTRQKIVELIKNRYSTTPSNPMQLDMMNYFNENPSDEWSSDVILMERIRNILETKHILAHNGSFEYKVGSLYGIDTNLKDDTMIMHQLMYKFRSTTSNRGEPSNLKYLAKVELGIDQWELGDFFPDFKEDNTGLVRAGGKSRGKKGGSHIDFSYMDYDGTRVYAPTDGDVTYLLFKKYKTDMIKNHKEMEYIYNVEIIVSCCIGYMEFWGHRLDESKILAIRDQTKAELACIESEIRQTINYAKQKEIDAYNDLKQTMAEFKEADEHGTNEDREKANNKTLEATANLYKAIEEDEEHTLNLASPAQVGELFYDVLGYPMSGDKKSVAKKEIKPLLKARDEDGNPMYPVANMYSEYKNKDTLLVKFFDNLPYYMYPGGYIFSSFGQISTATGRMSCSKPNAQQYPKAITKIVSPRPGFVMCDADYSQIEYRVLTAMANNTELAKLFSDPDSDYHTLMASLMYDIPYASVTPKQRGDAKSFNFGIPYGMGFKSLAILLKGNSKPSSVEEAKEKYELYFKNQPRTRKFFDQVKEMALVNKYTKTFWSRYRYYSFTDADGNENNARKASALRQAGNAVIQGCLDGDIRIETKKYGIVKIKDVVDQHLKVWDGNKWSNGDILYSGKKQKCIITFSNGQKFICSPIHKFLKVEGDPYKDTDYIECKKLKHGDSLEINEFSDLRIDNYDDTKMISVESVEITDEYIDMYDVCNTDGGYYVADGIITHNTAADIFKISVARNFSYIRANHLLGQLLIINMIHDEQLFEVDVQHLNMQRILGDIGKNMQFKVEGFPPLYIGAGIGSAWGTAKGKMAEIHPLLLKQLTEEAENIPIKHEDQGFVDPKDVLKYFDARVLEFRRQKVENYLRDPNNYYKDLHPAIGNLLNLQFTYGHDKDKEGLDDNQFTLLCVDEFIKHNNIEGVNSSMFTAQETVKEEEEDTEYTDGDDIELDDDGEIYDGSFSLIDESDVAYGATVQDLIATFHLFVSTKMKVCGLDTMNMSSSRKDEIVNFLADHLCSDEDPGSMEIVFLQPGNILNRTGLYVNNISGSEVEKRLHLQENQTVL